MSDREDAPTDLFVIPVPKFYLPLHLEYLDGRQWRLIAAFTYGSVILARVLEIPAGFVTDFASIPRLLWRIWLPTGPYGKAALVHDWVYRTPGIASRAQADAVLFEAMGELQVNWLTRHLIYHGVRVGGGASYRGGIP